MEQGPMSHSSLGRKSPRALRSPTLHYPLRLQTNSVPRSRTHNTVRATQTKSACIYFGLDFLIRNFWDVGWFSVVMSSIGSGLFSRLSRNSVRELLSPLLGEGYSWLMGFGLWTSQTPVFYQMGLKELPVRELYFGDSTGPESLPKETSCRSGNCACILVSKLSESDNTTFSVDHHDASSKTTCGETYALLVVGSIHLHPFFCSSYPYTVSPSFPTLSSTGQAQRRSKCTQIKYS